MEEQYSEYKIFLKDVDKQIVLIMIDGIPLLENQSVEISKPIEHAKTREEGWWIVYETKIPTGLVIDVWEKKFPHGDTEFELVESFRSGDKRKPKTTKELEQLTWSIESN